MPSKPEYAQFHPGRVIESHCNTGVYVSCT
jgi:hypothetical protein